MLLNAMVRTGAKARDGRDLEALVRQQISIQGADARPGKDLPQRDDQGWPSRLLLVTDDRLECFLYAINSSFCFSSLIPWFPGPVPHARPSQGNDVASKKSCLTKKASGVRVLYPRCEA